MNATINSFSPHLLATPGLPISATTELINFKSRFRQSDQLTPTPRRVHGLFPTNGDGRPAPCRRRVLGPSNLPPAYQQLFSPTRPGLTLSEFRNLFSRCGSCGLVKTSDALGTHKCVEVIDLTTDED